MWKTRWKVRFWGVILFLKQVQWNFRKNCRVNKEIIKVINRQNVKFFLIMYTSLLYIIDDITSASDKVKVTDMVLLAFSKVLKTSKQYLTLAIIALLWSYRECGWSYCQHFMWQRVSLGENNSKSMLIQSGVPKGPILGPLLLSIYTLKVTQCFHTCKYHLYVNLLLFWH